MPEQAIFHERNAAAFYSVGDDATWRASFEGNAAQGFFDFLKIVAVDFADGPPTGTPFVGEGREIENVADIAQALNFVVVDDGGQTIEAVMRGEENRFPDRAFVALAIAQEHEYAKRSGIVFGGESHSAAEGKAVTERAGGDFDAGDGARRVSRESGAVGVKLLEPGAREKTLCGEGGIQRGAGMAFAQDEPIAIRPIGPQRIYFEDAAVEYGQQVGDRETRADVRAASPINHFERVTANEARKVGQFGLACRLECRHRF